MKTVSLSGSLRENVGKKDAKALRNAGKVPCVLYGGKEQVHFTADAASFKPIIFTPETFLIEVDVDGKKYNAILQDVQYHPLSDKLLHADFLLVSQDKPVTVYLPVKHKGTSPGVIRGGKLNLKMNKIRVKGLIKDLPEFIMVDISKLQIGQSVKVRDLSLENISFLSPTNAVIIDVKTARGAALEGEEETEEGEATESAEGGEAPKE
ncbi:MAG: 50S ribosomal protein L25/general stress protein Ctc [Bacteroidales bacterium]|jgi:large subunit ribosomal protein L25|nr:50S ribosomal protein L25/general stress protein Ctc [Bacteroidales bacterium]